MGGALSSFAAVGAGFGGVQISIVAAGGASVLVDGSASSAFGEGGGLRGVVAFDSKLYTMYCGVEADEIAKGWSMSDPFLPSLLDILRAAMEACGAAPTAPDVKKVGDEEGGTASGVGGCASGVGGWTGLPDHPAYFLIEERLRLGRWLGLPFLSSFLLILLLRKDLEDDDGEDLFLLE